MSESLQKSTTARFKNYQHIAAAAAAPRSNDARKRAAAAPRRFAPHCVTEEAPREQ